MARSWTNLFTVTVVALSIQVCPAQVRTELERGTPVPLRLELADVSPEHFKSDASGNLYFFAVNEEGARTVVRVSRSGEDYPRFDIPKEDAATRSQILDFSPGPHGDMWLLIMSLLPAADATNTDRRFYLINLSREGKLESKLEIKDFSPVHVAEFQTGKLLLVGSEKKSSHSDSRPAFLILSNTGQLIRKSPVSVKKNKSTVKKDSGNQKKPETGKTSYLSSASLHSSDDGNIYARGSDPNTVIVFSPTLEQQRVLTLEPPAGNFELVDFRPGGGLIAAMFRKLKRVDRFVHTEAVVYSLHDLSDGRAKVQFDVVPPSMALVGYDSPSKEFLSVRWTQPTADRLELVRSFAH